MIIEEIKGREEIQIADNSNGWHFKRGLQEDFMKELESIAKQGGWFADVLSDPDLILGIRNNYINIYWHGQSLFKIEPHRKFSTHPKYLLDPGLSNAVRFDGTDFQLGRHDALTAHYDGETTLKKMKRAAGKYAGEEKEGVHAIVRSNDNVLDTEVTFNSKEEEDDERLTQRIDLADFEDRNGKILLRFWEAKLFTNGEIHAGGDVEAAVVEQVRGYRKLVEKHKLEIVESYRNIAKNLVEIFGWVTPQRKVGKLVKAVAEGADFTVDSPPMVGLVVYGYDSAQKESKRWKTDMAKLEKETLMPICRAGDPKNIKLRGTRP
jgi:hypothetical protein